MKPGASIASVKLNRALSRASRWATHILAIIAAWSFCLTTFFFVFERTIDEFEPELRRRAEGLDLIIDFVYLCLGPGLTMVTSQLNIVRGLELVGKHKQLMLQVVVFALHILHSTGEKTIDGGRTNSVLRVCVVIFSFSFSNTHIIHHPIPHVVLGWRLSS